VGNTTILDDDDRWMDLSSDVLDEQLKQRQGAELTLDDVLDDDDRRLADSDSDQGETSDDDVPASTARASVPEPKPKQAQPPARQHAAGESSTTTKPPTQEDVPLAQAKKSLDNMVSSFDAFLSKKSSVDGAEFPSAVTRHTKHTRFAQQPLVGSDDDADDNDDEDDDDNDEFDLDFDVNRFVRALEGCLTGVNADDEADIAAEHVDESVEQWEEMEAQLQAELKESTILQGFTTSTSKQSDLSGKPSHPPHSNNQGGGTDNGNAHKEEEEEDADEIDLDMNLVSNFLQSYASQDVSIQPRQT
jgi:hypothetical protein